jgi:hypothetical protein
MQKYLYVYYKLGPLEWVYDRTFDLDQEKAAKKRVTELKKLHDDAFYQNTPLKGMFY